MKLLKQNNLILMYILCLIAMVLISYYAYNYIIENDDIKYSYNVPVKDYSTSIIINNINNNNDILKINDNVSFRYTGYGLELITDGSDNILKINDNVSFRYIGYGLELITNNINMDDIDKILSKSTKKVNDVSYKRYVTELLNVRESPDTDSNVLGKLKIKTEINVTGEVEDDNWVRIKFKDGEGYVCADYLVDSIDGIENFTYNWDWNGPKLNPYNGANKGVNGKETYYNLDMSKIVRMMQQRGFGEYWIRSDGVKMLGNYVMVAANLNVHPRGSLVETSLGTGLVCDTGTFAISNPHQLDIATTWE